MRTYILAAALAALSAPSIVAQSNNLPEGTIGVPYYIDLGSGLEAALSAIPPNDAGVTFSYSFTATSPPPGLTMQPNGVFSGIPSAAGSFSFTYAFQGSISAPLLPMPFMIGPFLYHVVLVVGGSSNGGAVTVDPSGLNFPFTAGMTAAASQSLSVSNPSSAPKTFTAAATALIGGSWLSVSPGSGNLASFGSSSIQVIVNPAGLLAGTYTGIISVKISPSGESFGIPVNAVITSNQQSIVLSLGGLRFRAVQGGAAPPAASVTVLNGGPGTLNFSAGASTTSGGNWLSISPSTGSSNSTTASAIAVSVNPAGLAPGDYYGQISVTSATAGNSPQIATVVLNVTTAANSPGISLSTTGLVFVAAAKGTNPSAKSVVLANPSPTPTTLTTFTNSGTFTAMASATTVITGQPVTVQVQPNISGLAPGVYLGELDITGTTGNGATSVATFYRVALLLVVTPSVAGSAAQTTIGGACTPQKLLPVFTQLGSGFNVAAGWPVPLELTIVDDCGNFLSGGGSVIASFTSGDPAISLNSLKDGRWVATWQPHVAAPQVTITGKATEIQPSLQGTAQLGGGLMPNPAVPIVGAGGVVSSASYAKQAPIAPGGFISIFGTALSGGTFASPQLPLSTNLGGTQVTLGGRLLPLLIMNGGQINAQLPFDVPANSVQQLVVQRDSALSLPESVTIASGGPGVFAQNSQGTGDGSIQDYPPTGPYFTVDSTHPASAGDVLVIYCAGLGAVYPPVPAGSAAPSSPPAITVNPVSVTIGGMQVPVGFAGLTPTFTGLYQINTVVPAGLASGNQPVVITVAGQQSPPVTLNVH
jgi:uncharacterized protein (TIGR03437 family)